MHHDTPTPPEQPRSTAAARICTDAMLRDALAYWDGLRAGRVAPARTDLDPKALSDLLGHAALLERPRPGTIRIRLAGGRIAALMGMEMAGMPLRSLFDLSHRRRLTEAAEAAFDTPSVLLATLSAGPGPDQTAQMALMPLSDPAGLLARAFFVLGEGACRISGPPPCRWRLDRIDHIALRADAAVMPAHALASAGPAQRPRLRVIEGGRR